MFFEHKSPVGAVIEVRVYRWLGKKGAWKQVERLLFTEQATRDEIMDILYEVLEGSPQGQYRVEIYEFPSGKLVQEFVIFERR